MKRTSGRGGRARSSRSPAAVARAVAWVRRGEPDTARQLLERLRRRDRRTSLAVALELARLAALRGDTAAARTLLRDAQPSGEAASGKADWLVASALVQLLEGQFGEASQMLHAARLAKRRARAPVPAELTALAVVAHLGLDEIAEARALVDRSGHDATEPLPPELRALLRAAADLRAGALVACEAAAQRAVMAATDDAPVRALGELLRARALHAQGRLDDSERALGHAEGIMLDPGFSGLRGLSDIAAMLLCATRGRWREAKRRANMAATRLPSSALAASETRWAQGGRDGATKSAATPPSLAARASLREAERCLSAGELDAAVAAARAAARWYARSGAHYDHAFALLVAAEGRARLGDDDAAARLLDECEALAKRERYGLVLVRGALVRAAIADRRGAFDAYAVALAQASRCAGDDSFGRAIDSACARIGLEPPRRRYAPGQPWRIVVERLGLDRPGTHLALLGERLWVLGADETMPASAELSIDLDRLELARGRRRWRCSQRHALVLALLAIAAERGLDADELYVATWGGGEYHPLRHRNSVYVTMNRVRASLAKAGLRAALDHGDEGRYRLACARATAVRVALPTSKSALFARAEVPLTVEGYAAAAQVSPPQAAWELGLRAAAIDAPAERFQPQR